MAQDKDKISRYNNIIVKRYQNRKLYDTNQSRYVTLEDIAEMIREGNDVSVIDNKSKRDITEATLIQIIFDSEKKAAQYAPISVLKEVIKSENGSFSHYLSKLGVFTFPTTTQAEQTGKDTTISHGRVSSETSKGGTETSTSTLSENISFDSEGPTNLPHSTNR